MQKSERDQVLNFITKLASKLPPEAQGIFTEEQVHGVVSKTLENFKDKIPDLKAEEVRSTGEQYEFFPKTDSVEAEQGRNENDGKGEIMKKNVVDFLTERPNFLGRSEDTQKRLQVVLPLVWDQLQAAAPRLDREPIFVALAEAKIKAKKEPKVKIILGLESDDEKNLFAKLKAKRMEIARAQNLPPYIVFHDKTLIEMIKKHPQNLEEMRKISGVGEEKLKKYGQIFLNLIGR